MSGRRAFRSLICAGCGMGYSGNYAQDMLYRHCREKHPELKGRVTRWGLEGPVPVDAVPSSAVGLCNLQCDEVLPEDLRDLELGPESRDQSKAICPSGFLVHLPSIFPSMTSSVTT